MFTLRRKKGSFEKCSKKSYLGKPKRFFYGTAATQQSNVANYQLMEVYNTCYPLALAYCSYISMAVAQLT